jgi:hypothetical protein
LFNLVLYIQSGYTSTCFLLFEIIENNVSVNGNTFNITHSSTLDDDDEGYADPDSLDDTYKDAEKISVLLAEEDWKTLEPLGHQFHKMIRSCKYRGIDCR